MDRSRSLCIAGGCYVRECRGKVGGGGGGGEVTPILKFTSGQMNEFLHAFVLNWLIGQTFEYRHPSPHPTASGSCSVVKHQLMVRSVMVDPLSYFSQCSTTVCNKCRGMCYPVCGMVSYKRTLAVTSMKHRPYSGGSGFPLSLSGSLP